jgi:hypothetical protein
MLSSNPFPESAIVKIDSDDIRINGTVFLEAVFQKEIATLRDKINAQNNVIYLAGLQIEKGVGKSALLVHEMRMLEKRSSTPTAYVRCTDSSPNNKPTGFCTSIINSLHNKGWLWKAFQSQLLDFCKERGGVRLSLPALETMFKTIRWPVDSLPLTLYTHVTDSSLLASKFSRWLAEKLRIPEQISLLFSTSYMTQPVDFPSKFSKLRSEDRIDIYASLLKILLSSGVGHCYFFLDQWEDSIVSTPASQIGGFCSGMRRVLEASANVATFILTLHPDSERKLNTHAAQHLLAIAPLDENHFVDVSVLDRRSDQVIPLAVDYMDHFRTGSTENPTYPLDPRVIRYICFVKEGCIRYILQHLHQGLKYGAMNDHPYVDMSFLLDHHAEIMGSELNERKYREFEMMQ